MVENIPEGYKKTEVGVIPEEWEVKSLGECLEEKPCYGINGAAVQYTENLPSYIRITDISEQGRFIKKNRTSVICDDASKYQLKENDIVFARTGASTGKSYLYNQDDGALVFAGFLIRTRINIEYAVPRYIKACVETSRFWDWVKMMSIRSGQPGINGNEYASFFVPIPPLPEQTAIAKALSDIDKLIYSLEKLIDKKKNIKQGAMQELLTGEKRLDGFSGELKEKDSICNISHGYKKTEAGIIPEDWIPTTLESMCLPKGLVRGPFGGALKKEIFVKSGFKVYEQRNAIYKNTKIGNYYIDKDKYDELTRFKVIPGDFIVSCSGTIGRIYKIPENVENGIINQALLKIRIDENKVNSSYFNLYFEWHKFQNRIIDTTQGGAMQNLVGMDVFKTTLIPLPPTIEEQKAIAQILSDMDSEIEKLNVKLTKYKEIKKRMMQELLTGKRRLI